MAEPTMRPGEQVLCCHAGAFTDPDLRTVQALARLQLVARRHGIALCLCQAPPALEELLALVGLDEVIPRCLGVQSGGQPEQGEQPSGVEEGVHRRDPAG